MLVPLPPMSPCPDCNIVLQCGDGPHGLAFHLCAAPGPDEPTEATTAAAEEGVRRGMVRALLDPKLDVKGAAMVLLRSAILRQLTDSPEDAANAIRALGGQRGLMGSLADLLAAEAAGVGAGGNELGEWIRASKATG